MRTSLPLAFAGAVLLSSSAVTAHDVAQQHQQHARHLQHGAQAEGMVKLVRRQGPVAGGGLIGGALSAASNALAGTTSVAAQTTPAAGTDATPAATAVDQTQASAVTSSSAATSAPVAATSAPVIASSSTTTASTTTSAATSSSSSSSSAASSSSSAPPSSASSASKVVSTLTSTSISSGSSISASAPSSSTAPSSSASSDQDKGGSSGLPKTTLIVIIVVASSIALVAAIWTIIRKTAFSPSRRFEAKLAPIDFDNDHDGRRDSRGSGDAILAHERSGSVMSGAQAGAGARHGEMSDRWGGGGYAPSLGRSDSGKGSLREMAYAPQSIPYNAAPSPAAYGGPQYYQQPYHGGSQYSASLPGYPQEQAYGYSNLQRGASSRTDLSRNLTSAGMSGRGTPAGPQAYDYAAQARAQQGRY